MGNCYSIEAFQINFLLCMSTTDVGLNCPHCLAGKGCMDECIAVRCKRCGQFFNPVANHYSWPTMLEMRKRQVEGLKVENPELRKVLGLDELPPA
jgi:hypothetical protein